MTAEALGMHEVIQQVSSEVRGRIMTDSWRKEPREGTIRGQKETAINSKGSRVFS